MCDPVTIGLAAGSAGLSVLDQVNANKVAKENYRYQRRLSSINRDLADRAAARQLLGLRARQLQERQAAGQQLQQIVGQARQAQAATRAVAAQTGTAGASVAAMTQDFERSQLQAQATLDRNLEFQDLEFERVAEGIRDQQRQSIVSSLPSPYVRGNLVVPALQGALSGTLAGLQLPPPAGGPTQAQSLQSVFSGFNFGSAQQQLGGGGLRSILQTSGLRIPT